MNKAQKKEMTIFVIVGMQASGKNLARIFAESNHIPYFATGDIVRDEINKRGLKPDANNTATLSTELRCNDGLGLTRGALSSALSSESAVVFMEGMRSLPEIELIKGKAICVLVAFVAPKYLRLQRIISRRRPDDSPDAFEKRDQREIEYGAAAPIALADEYILNTGAIEDSVNELRKIVEKYTL